MIQRALISVTDKTGLIEFVQSLIKNCKEISFIASEGTANYLKEHGILVTTISDYTGFSPVFSGRVKTLHPKIAGGILMRQGVDEKEAERHGILPIDLVICNLYDFEKASEDKGMETDELIESMDIGGSTLIRSSIKNFQRVAVVVDPKDYEQIAKEVEKTKGVLSLETKKKLAVKAMHLSAHYEAVLDEELSCRLVEEKVHRPTLKEGKKLRYGENPDQSGWVYRFSNDVGIAQAKVLGGKELSYNNFEDATQAFNAAFELHYFNQPAVCIFKHGGLCGLATGTTQQEAFERAWEGDPKSAFGSVIGFTHPLDETCIPLVKDKFIEVIIAPDFSSSFLDFAKKEKPNLRLIQMPKEKKTPLSYKYISGGMLVQTQKKQLIPSNLKALFQKATDSKMGVVTAKSPKLDQENLFAFSILSLHFGKSNTVTLSREWKRGCYQLVGIGAGQPNRVDSLQRLAIPKAKEVLGRENLDDCLLASDGFFPFDDSIRYAASYGIRQCLQPGGGIKDKEVIAAADELGVVMSFTGERYFTH